MLYRVKNGDSLSKVAMRELGDINKWKVIARLNKLSPPYIIHPNELLLLPDVKPAQRIEITKPLPEKKKGNAGLWIAGGIAALLALMG